MTDIPRHRLVVHFAGMLADIREPIAVAGVCGRLAGPLTFRLWARLCKMERALAALIAHPILHGAGKPRRIYRKRQSRPVSVPPDSGPDAAGTPQARPATVQDLYPPSWAIRPAPPLAPAPRLRLPSSGGGIRTPHLLCSDTIPCPATAPPRQQLRRRARR